MLSKRFTTCFFSSRANRRFFNNVGEKSCVKFKKPSEKFNIPIVINHFHFHYWEDDYTKTIYWRTVAVSVLLSLGAYQLLQFVFSHDNNEVDGLQSNKPIPDKKLSSNPNGYFFLRMSNPCDKSYLPFGFEEKVAKLFGVPVNAINSIILEDGLDGKQKNPELHIKFHREFKIDEKSERVKKLFDNLKENNVEYIWHNIFNELSIYTEIPTMNNNNEVISKTYPKSIKNFFNFVNKENLNDNTDTKKHGWFF